MAPPRTSALLASKHARMHANHAHGRHGTLYKSLLPGMLPVALLASAVYMALHLARDRLAHERLLDDAAARIAALEGEVDALLAQRSPSPLQS